MAEHPQTQNYSVTFVNFYKMAVIAAIDMMVGRATDVFTKWWRQGFKHGQNSESRGTGYCGRAHPFFPLTGKYTAEKKIQQQFWLDKNMYV